MGLMTALARGAPAGADTKSFAGTPAGFGFFPSLGGAQATSGVVVSQATAMKVAAVYACVRIRSRDVARCTPSVLSDDGKGTKTVVTDHELARLFAKPNRVQTWFEFCEQMGAGYLLRGNAYAVKLRDWRGSVVEIIPINPDLVELLEAPDGSLFYSVARNGLWMMAVLGDMPIAIPAEDIFHLRDLSFNGLVGWSRISLARDMIGLAMSQEQQAARWTGNGARPAGVLTVPKKLDAAAALRLKTSWERAQQGLHNTGSTAVLEDGVTWAQMQLNSVDFQFLEQRRHSVRDVARFFDVPMHKLMEADGQAKATIAELNADYVQTTVMGDVVRWEQRLAHDWGLAAEGLAVSMDESLLLRADMLSMMNYARFGTTSGLISQNEGRSIIGYGPKTGQETGPDALLAPTNLAPNGSAVDGRAPDGAGRPAEGQLPGDNSGSG